MPAVLLTRRSGGGMIILFSRGGYGKSHNELAIWSLMAMAIPGAYLWLSSRPWYRPAQIAFAGGSGFFLCSMY